METKLLVELVIIVVAAAAAIWWILSNYQTISTGFFEFLGTIPLFSRGG